MGHVLFDIPKIVRLICETLDRTSLVRLLVVSRRLFDSVAPLVWKNVTDSDAHYISLCLRAGITHCFKDGHLKSHEKLGLLYNHFRDRWNAYAPLVKQISRNFNDTFDKTWNTLPSNAASLPCPPNLQVFEFSAPSSEFVSQLDAHLGPSVTKIYHRAGGYELVNVLHTLELVKTVAQHCPNIHTLQFFNADPRATVTETKSGYTNELPRYLEGFSDLRVLGLGPIALESKVFTSLGKLSHLESLTVSIGRVLKPWLARMDNNDVCPESFPALRHLGIGCRKSTALDTISQLWRIPILVQQLTSISLTLVTKTAPEYDDGLCDLIDTVCRSSPNVTDLHLKLISTFIVNNTNIAHPPRLFPPKICSSVKQLALQHMIISLSQTYTARIDANYEELALALPDVEFLHLRERDPLLDSDFSPSPSTLYLEGTMQRVNPGEGDVRRVANGLHQLWPKGVYCCPWATRKCEESFWLQLNDAIARLRASQGLEKAVAMSRYGGWKYITERTTPELSRFTYRRSFD